MCDYGAFFSLYTYKQPDASPFNIYRAMHLHCLPAHLLVLALSLTAALVHFSYQHSDSGGIWSLELQ